MKKTLYLKFCLAYLIFGIFGFILASLVGIYAQPTYYDVIDFWTIFFVILFLVSGFFISYLLSVFAEKKSIKSEV